MRVFRISSIKGFGMFVVRTLKNLVLTIDRYEYRKSIHANQQFVIRMESAFHQSIGASIEFDLMSWRAALINDKNRSIICRTAAEKMVNMRTSKMVFGQNVIRGDHAFGYDDDQCAYPSLVFEIRLSQSSDDLEKKAMELLEEVRGEVRTVVGLDFYGTWKIWKTLRDDVGDPVNPRRGPFKAFVWLAVFDGDGQRVFGEDGPILQKRNHVFCEENGDENINEKLQLSLRDFIPPRIIVAERWQNFKELDETKFQLDAATMINHFDKALKAQKKEDRKFKPRKDRRDEERRIRKLKRAAKRNANTEKEHRYWSMPISSIGVGGHSLRNLKGGISRSEYQQQGHS